MNMIGQPTVVQYNQRARTSHDRCSQCRLGPLCLGAKAAPATMAALESIVRPTGLVDSGTRLFSEGEAFSSLFAVRSGCVKTSTFAPDGSEQVLGFHLPGDIVGLDAIHDGQYHSTASALGSVSYCAFPFTALSQLSAGDVQLQRRMYNLMSRSLADAIYRVGDATADQRVAAFLLNMSAHYRARGFSATHFILAMPRRDIANYLRLATETVSRVLTRFQNVGLIAASRREVRLLDLDGLAAAAA